MGGGGVWHLQQIYFNSFFPDCRIQVNIKFALKKFHSPLLFLKYFHNPTKFSGMVSLPHHFTFSPLLGRIYDGSLIRFYIIIISLLYL